MAANNGAVSVGSGSAIFQGVVTGVIAGSIMWFLQSRLSTASSIDVFPRDDFFQPDEVAYIAALIEAEDDESFILDAWDWVGGTIPYEPIGSEVFFRNGTVECQDCYLAPQVIARNKGNCLAKSSLLASLMLYRIDPSRVRIVLGDVFDGGEAYGHAWVEWERGDVWCILESTLRPDPSYPWIPAESVSNYIGTVYFSLTDYLCDDDEMCLAVSPSCNCYAPVLFDK